MNTKALNTNEIHTEENYPWGSTKTTKALHLIDFSPKEGFRYISQVFDIDTNKWGRASTEIYAPFIYLYIDEKTGYIERKRMPLDFYDEITDCCQAIATHFDNLQLTPEMITYLYTQIRSAIKETHIHEIPHATLMAFFKPQLDLLSNAITTGENIFGQVKIDLAGIQKLREEATRN